MLLDGSSQIGGDGDGHHSDSGKMYRATNGCPPPLAEPYSPPKVSKILGNFCCLSYQQQIFVCDIQKI